MLSTTSLTAAGVFFAALSLVTSSRAIEQRKSPEYEHSFQLPLVIPPVKEPLATYINSENGVPIEFYQLEVKEAMHSFYPNLRNASIIGFDGKFMGPTFRVQKGHESVVRVINKSNKKTNLHLHGSFTRSPFDGWAMDVLNAGEFKDYYYPNSINARSLWYHDHANKVNTINIYRGMFGMYQIVDLKLDNDLGLPHGGKYDVPLAFTAHYFTQNGDLSDESKERSSIWGDTWVVNGQIQPYLDVEPRKYRFRILNAAVSRGLNISIELNETPISFHVIGSDGGLRQSPVKTKSLVTGMGERWEIIVDFASHKGQNLLVRTTNTFNDQAYEGMDKAMQFRVGQTLSSEEGNGNLLTNFNINLKFPEDRIAVTREFKLMSHMDMMWGINSYHMDDPMKRVMMKPPLGTIEKIVFKSGGMSMGSMAGMMGGKNPSSGGSTKESSSTGSGMTGMSGSSGSTHSSHHGGGGMMGSGRSSESKGDMSVASGSSSIGNSGASASMTNNMGSHGSNNMDGMKSQPDSSSMNGMMSGHSSHHGGSMMRRASAEKRQDMDMSGMMKGMDHSTDYWSHSMHLHLVDLRIVGRYKEHNGRPEGRDTIEEYEKNSLKDIAFLGSNEVVEVLVKYQPYPGLYMWHCHNAVHEDNGMMAVMNITRLVDLGYGDLDLRLDDPMDLRFRPQKFRGTNLEDVKANVLPAFARLRAYPDPLKMREIEDQYWEKKPIPNANLSSAEVPKNVDPDKQALHDSHHGNNSQMNMNGSGTQNSMHGGISQNSMNGSTKPIGSSPQNTMGTGGHGHHGSGGMGGMNMR